MVALAVPIAELPVPKAMVKVGPPLSCRGPRLSCSEVTVVAQENEPCETRLFAAVEGESRMTPPKISPPLVLLAIMVLAILRVPPYFLMPPPLDAELPERVELETVAMPLVKMPPPSLEVAELPKRVELLTMRVAPEFAIPPPPPPVAELAERVELDTVSVPLWPL